MQLTVRDVSTLLSVSEKTIYRWVKQGVLPAYRVNEQYRVCFLLENGYADQVELTDYH